MRRCGLSEAVIDDMLGEDGAEIDGGNGEVWDENWPTVRLFLETSTQWRVGGMGGAVGLDYLAVRQVARWIGQRVTPEVFEGIRIMEAAVLTFWAERHSESRRSA